MNISIIVAIAENNVIGINNQLIWHLPNDLKRFKEITMGHHMIMGRKTWESIGRALPGRTTIVVTRNKDFKPQGALVAHSLEDALEMAKADNEIFVVGGGELYRQALPLANKFYLTRVHQSYEGDTFFPEIDMNQWVEVYSQEGEPAQDGPRFTYINLERAQ